MAGTLGDVVASMFSRAFNDGKKKPVQQALQPPQPRPAARTTISQGVVVTLSAEAQQALAGMQRKISQDGVGLMSPRTLHTLDVSA